MPTVYRLTSGAIERDEFEPEQWPDQGEEADIFRARYRAPHEFVPSPGELKANKFRMRAVGEVSADHIEAANANLNTNEADKTAIRRRTFQDTSTVDRKPMDEAVRMIAEAGSVVLLDKYEDQEMNRRPRARKGVLKALEDRRDELSAAGV